jgi:hypothetical protein
LDTLLAARKLQQQQAAAAAATPATAVTAGGPQLALPAASPPSGGSGGGSLYGDALLQSPAVAAAAAAAHAGRTSVALAQLKRVTAAPAGRARLAALGGLSDKLLSGLHWLPAHELPPASDPSARRAVLLEELRRLYAEELPRAGLTPDAWTLNTVLAAYCAAGDDASAYGFLTREFARWRVQPSVVTYRSLIRLAVAQRRTDTAQGVLGTLAAHALRPDRDCYGMVVHALARDWRVKDAIALLVQAREAGAPLPEHWVALLRARCKELAIRHPDVPEHPVAWQFSPRALEARRKQGRDLRKSVDLGLRHRMAGGLRV